jgi:hypothetical protein
LVDDRGSRIVCILGMHRSGTSSLAGSLQEAGLPLGDVITAATYNVKGNRENKRIMKLHDAILGDSGGSWDRPPEHVKWSAAHRAERDAIVRSFANHAMWGFKDPRTMLLLSFWQEALSNLAFVGTLRHPRLVAESLFRRGGGSMDDWLALWADYNARMLALHEADPFPIVRFDLGEEAYRRSLSIVIDSLGLQMPERMEFFDPVLRHHKEPPSPQLPETVDRLYRSLCRIALDPQGACPARSQSQGASDDTKSG